MEFIEGVNDCAGGSSLSTGLEWRSDSIGFWDGLGRSMIGVVPQGAAKRNMNGFVPQGRSQEHAYSGLVLVLITARVVLPL